MRLQRRLQKAMAIAMVATVGLTAMPTFAIDYKGHWAENAIATWSQKGIVKGYEDGTFKPNSPVTRAELASFISRMFGLTDITNAKKFTDVETGKWYTEEVNKITSAGIMNDYNTTFKPDQKATREEAAYAIAKAYKITEGKKANFKDADKISEWAVEEIAALASGNYVSGRPDGKFAPKDTLTRADVVSMIDKITAELVSKAGTYNKDVKGNLVINTKDVVLQKMTIDGNLYLAEGIGEGDVTLDNVKVTGKVFVEGGGSNSIKLKGTKLNAVEIKKAKGAVRIAADAKSEVTALKALSGAKLEGKFGKVEVATKAAMEFVGATVAEVAVTTEGATVKFDDKSVVEKLVVDKKAAIENKGQIKELVANANGITVAGKAADKTTVGQAVTEKPSQPSTEASGGGGGGGSSSGGGSVTPSKKKMDFKQIRLHDENGYMWFNMNEGTNAVAMNLEGNNLSVVIGGQEQSLESDYTITGISLDSNMTSKFEAYVGVKTALTTCEIDPAKTYNETDAVAILDGGKLQGINETLQGLVGKNGFTQAQADRAKELVSTMEKELREAAASADGVQISRVIQGLNKIEQKLNDKDVKAAYNQVKDVLSSQYGINVVYGEKGVKSISTKVSFVEEGYYGRDIACTFNFK